MDPVSYARFEELSKIWERVVQLEVDFWDMGMRGDGKIMRSSTRAGIPPARL